MRIQIAHERSMIASIPFYLLFCSIIVAFILLVITNSLLVRILGSIIILFSLLTLFSIFRYRITFLKREALLNDEKRTLANSLSDRDILLSDLVPAIELLIEEDEAIKIASDSGIGVLHLNGSDTPTFDRLRQFANSFTIPADSSISRIRGLSFSSSATARLAEIERRVPYVYEILKRVVLHTEQAALTLIENFSTIYENTDKAETDAHEALKSLSSSNKSETGLDTLIKRSYDTVVGSRSVINDFLHLNRENGERVKKISDLVTKSEELIIGIEDIAERSKLIAFNMAVESAKIGDKGRGFKVIVNELQRLNTQTTGFARDIMSIVKSFRIYNQELMDQWLVKSESLTEKVKEDSDQAEQALNALTHSYELNGKLFRSVSESAIGVNKSMSEILQSLQFQDITRQQIEGAEAFIKEIHEGILELENQFKSLGFSAGSESESHKIIRSTYTPKLKVTSDHEIFDIIERRNR
jgi:methyl-accepting chemotaxis protein